MRMTDKQFHPSYPSAKALTDDILSDPTDRKDIMQIRTAPFKPQMEEVMKTLPILKKDRPHGPKAVQSEHDLTANSSKLDVSVCRPRAEISSHMAHRRMLGCSSGRRLHLHHTLLVSR